MAMFRSKIRPTAMVPSSEHLTQMDRGMSTTEDDQAGTRVVSKLKNSERGFEVTSPYFAGSVLRNSIPAASSGTSTLATILRVARSIISTVPGSDPTPSTETKA
jgi:hypothetical protein